MKLSILRINTILPIFISIIRKKSFSAATKLELNRFLKLTMFVLFSLLQVWLHGSLESLLDWGSLIQVCSLKQVVSSFLMLKSSMLWIDTRQRKCFHGLYNLFILINLDFLWKRPSSDAIDRWTGLTQSTVYFFWIIINQKIRFNCL